MAGSLNLYSFSTLLRGYGRVVLLLSGALIAINPAKHVSIPLLDMAKIFVPRGAL